MEHSRSEPQVELGQQVERWQQDMQQLVADRLRDRSEEQPRLMLSILQFEDDLIQVKAVETFWSSGTFILATFMYWLLFID